MRRLLIRLRGVLIGRRLRDAIERHDRAADQLDHAIREVLTR